MDNEQPDPYAGAKAAFLDGELEFCVEEFKGQEGRWIKWNSPHEPAWWANPPCRYRRAHSAGWIQWGGGKCPIGSYAHGTIEIQRRSGIFAETLFPNLSDWTHMGHSTDIVAYRVISAADREKRAKEADEVPVTDVLAPFRALVNSLSEMKPVEDKGPVIERRKLTDAEVSATIAVWYPVGTWSDPSNKPMIDRDGPPEPKPVATPAPPFMMPDFRSDEPGLLKVWPMDGRMGLWK